MQKTRITTKDKCCNRRHENPKNNKKNENKK